MIYFALQNSTGFIKIGFTDDIPSRMINLKREFGRFELLGLMDGDIPAERNLQKRFKHIKAEFRREFFMDTPELREFIYMNTSLPALTTRTPKVKTRVLRTDPHVETALRMYAGEIQAASGSSITDSDAVENLIQSVRPDLLIRVRTKTPTNNKPSPKGSQAN